ncbi:hypothetical protein BOX15_Mlig006631g1 [Macrostomum lignano]|uniref:Caspase family p20 domain-containing protein n=1 Tax=Macrostomum lignano TaxID=282301 RepID=A0A267EI05_9PLAT|nr:hypothetical protein BOX15_Mlig006631g1 [Macrostomum lignano]
MGSWFSKPAPIPTFQPTFLDRELFFFSRFRESTYAVETLSQLVIEADFSQLLLKATTELMTKTDAAERTVLMLVADAHETPVQTEKCIWFLFKLGADPKATDRSGNTAAHLAARRDNLRVLALIPFEAKWLRNEDGATPLMEAARAGSWKCTKHLLHLLRQLRFNECSTHGNSKRSRLLGLKDHRGRTASDLARLNDHSELANYIELEMRLVFDCNGSITGLDFVESWLKDMKKLIEDENYSALVQKVNRFNCDLPNSQGNTFSIMFIYVSQPRQRSNPDTTNLNQETFLKKLLQVSDPTCANTYGMSALHIAAYKGNSAAATALLNAGARANVMCLEWTPLMLAACCTQQDAAASVCWILLCAGSNWSLKNREGKTALDLANEQGSHKMAELLRRFHDMDWWTELPYQTRRGQVGTTDSLSTESFRENDAWTTRPQYQTGSGESGASYSYEYRRPPATYISQASRCTPQSLQAVDQHSAVESDCSSNSSRSDEFYPVTNPQGLCVIINISKFESSSEGERKGSQFDVERVSELFSKLGFIIDVREDLTADEIENYLDCVRIWKELERHGAFVCFLMTHGREDCIVGSDGKPCKIFDLTRKFQPK